MGHRTTRTARTLAAAVVAAVAMLALTAATAMAGWEIQDQSGNPYTGTINLELASPLVEFMQPNGNGINCNESVAAGEITDSGATSGAPAGELASLEFSQDGSPSCPVTGTGISSVELAGTSIPWTVSIINDPGTGAPVLVLDDPEVTFPVWGGGPFDMIYQADQIAAPMWSPGVGDPTIATVSETFTHADGAGYFTYELELSAQYELLDADGGNLHVAQTP